MKEITATQLKTNVGDFFEALLSDGGVVITRHGKRYPVALLEEEALVESSTLRTEKRAEKLDRFLAAQRTMQEALRGETPESLGIDAEELDRLEEG